jgi:DNA-directed RNA polymerase specialized sigma24 family protein
MATFALPWPRLPNWVRCRNVYPDPKDSDFERDAKRLEKRALINAKETVGAQRSVVASAPAHMLEGQTADSGGQELRQVCDDLISKVPGRGRSVLRGDLDGKTSAEIASDLDLSVSNVDVLRHRSLAYLRQRYRHA